jgi:molybdate transport system ATP-binding protein
MANNATPLLPIVDIKDAVVRIGRNCTLKIDDFEISAGQHWCIFGGNGAGKTLLAKLLSSDLLQGRQYVTYGTDFDIGVDLLNVSFEEQQKLWASDNRHDLSEFMESAHDVGTSVADLLLNEVKGAEFGLEKVQAVLESLDIAQLLNKGIRFLSSGQVRKVLIARAVLANVKGKTKLLVLDDPLDAIDKQSKPRASELLSNWMDEENCTLVLCRREEDILPGITHMALMQDLSIICQGELEAVKKLAEYKAQVSRKPMVKLHLLSANQSADVVNTKQAVAPIHLINITAKYNEFVVLNNVTWLMENHHHTLIEGPNGCGKSTLLSLIDGENHKAYGQEVMLFGIRRGSGESVWEIKSHFGVISNEIHNKYVKGWKVLDVVVSGFFDSVGLYDDSGSSQIETANRWLSDLGIGQLAKAYFKEISFGQQRLVLLARAMVKQPDVLILDEPCVGLDSYFRALILDVVDQIAVATKTQIIFVSHTEGEAPSCINQHIRFVPQPSGGYNLDVQNLS